jgi:ATP-dependent DNA helicase RecQ
MQDQVEGLQQKGVRALGLYGSIGQQDLLRTMDNLRHGVYKIVYLSPERLQHPLVQEQLSSLPISLLAVDEAHCISQWGHDFRPAYLNIHLVRDAHPQVPVMALTATATPDVLKDIEEQLGLRNPVRVRNSYYRSNLRIRVAVNEDREGELLYWLDRSPGSGIVYVGSRKKSELLARLLQNRGVPAEAFHGGMEIDGKRKTLRRWLEGQTRVVVGTNAFGMGIDKEDVRLVVHFDLPDSLENYYQEAGRAGRDGKPARCIILCGPDSFTDQKSQYYEGLVQYEDLLAVYMALAAFFLIPAMEGGNQRFDFDFNAFCLRYELSPLKTLDALRTMEKYELIEVNTQGQRRSSLRITASRQQIRRHMEEQRLLGPIMETLVRNHGGIFDTLTEINEWQIARSLELSKSKLQDSFRRLAKLELIDYRPADKIWKLTWKHPREDERTLRPLRPFLEKYLKGKLRRIKKMQEMMGTKTQCRQQFIMGYFDQAIEPCGNCDLCAPVITDRRTRSEAVSSIIEMLRSGPRDSGQLLRETALEKEELLELLAVLLGQGKIRLTTGNQYEINS